MTNYQVKANSLSTDFKPQSNTHMSSNPEVIQGHYSLLPKLMILQPNLGEFSTNR